MKPIYLELDAVAGAVALAAPTVQRLVRENAFPKPKQLYGRRFAWLVREVEEWAEQRPISDLAPPPDTARSRH